MNHTTGPVAAEVATTPAAYRAHFAVAEHSARHLRRILRTYLVRWELTELADAAELALTELVANVVRHVPGRRCTTFIERLPGGDGVRVEVVDDCPALPRPGGQGPLAEGGRGLLLVAAVTEDWGVEPRRAGKAVWFECRREQRATVSPP